MLIVCNGMIRSGSTLQYNLIRLQVEATFSGKAEGFIGKKELNSERLQFWQKDVALHVIKSHDILPEWMRAEGIKLVYIYRDIRDVAVSLKNKSGRTGDRLLAYSDGIIEAMDGDSAQYGLPRLTATLDGNRHKSPDDLLSSIVDEVDAFNAEESLNDDIALLLVERR